MLKQSATVLAIMVCSTSFSYAASPDAATKSLAARVVQLEKEVKALQAADAATSTKLKAALARLDALGKWKGEDKVSGPMGVNTTCPSGAYMIGIIGDSRGGNEGRLAHVQAVCSPLISK